MSKSLNKIMDMICDELDNIAEKGELTAGTLETVDKLTHSLKSIVTIESMQDSGYSQDAYPHIRHENWRYSRDNESDRLIRQLRSVLDDASSDKDRNALKKCISEMKGN